MELVRETYALANNFPDHERYVLANQMTRSAVSIPSNIAEGTSKNSDKHINRFMRDSLGSAFEWETQLNIAHQQAYIDKDTFDKLEDKIQQLQKMISGFQKRLQPKQSILDS